MNKTVTSELVSIDDIISLNNQYNIPRYQRLYVWENSQVETLFEDLYEAYRTNRPFYYLGGVLIVKHKKSHHIYDLIDGQQRFTTLWLLSVELGGTLFDFAKFNSELRLLFSIRENIKYFFESVISGKSSLDTDEVRANSSLGKIINARNLIQGQIQKKFENDSDKIQEFASYIRKRVQVISTEISRDADLNKLFEVINNRGLQLQQHEILKTRILNHIKRSRTKYGKIWNACADMDIYIERSLRNEIGKNISAAYDKSDYSFHMPDLFRLMDLSDEESKRDAIDIISILDKRAKPVEEDDSDGEDENNEEDGLHPESEDMFENEPVRSILTFPQLLLHTLRIYLYKNGGSDITKIDEKELLKTFEKHFLSKEESDSTDFIKLLLDVRMCFDVFIIKWVKVSDNEEVHLIKKLYLNNQKRKQTYYFRREKPDSNDGFSLLQSMLYHSQQITTQYWLTPLLFKALELRDKEQLYEYLRHLDNHLFCTSRLDENLPQRTWKLLNKELSNSDLRYDIGILDDKRGVAYPHYWFYKLDFVLWFLLSGSRNKKWKEYRMTAKNSVEHISPQNPREYERYPVSKNMMNDFGNLVLVSRGINSEYGNKIFTTKRSEFVAKSNYDSLKSALIFENEVWNDDLAIQHREKMKKYLIKYFSEQ